MIRLGDIELEKALINWREKAGELADAESSYQYYESMMKITKATVFLETKDQGLTVKDREAMAEVHKDVVKYIDLFRTKSANIRGEMKLTGELG